jgi:hypothetical protein
LQQVLSKRDAKDTLAVLDQRFLSIVLCRILTQVVQFRAKVRGTRSIIGNIPIFYVFSAVFALVITYL